MRAAYGSCRCRRDSPCLGLAALRRISILVYGGRSQLKELHAVVPRVRNKEAILAVDPQSSRKEKFTLPETLLPKAGQQLSLAVIETNLRTADKRYIDVVLGVDC